MSQSSTTTVLPAARGEQSPPRLGWALVLLAARMTLGRWVVALPARGWLRLTAVGASMALYQVTYVLSIERIGVTLATLISIAGAPIFVALISALFRGERYPPRVLLGLLAAVAGAALLVGFPAPDGPTSDRYREGLNSSTPQR